VIELVIFDLGRVLIQTCDDWRHACRYAGIALPENALELNDAEHAAMEAVIARYDTGKITVQTFCHEIAPLRGLTPEQALKTHDVFLRGPYPGATKLLADLARANLKTACLSNTSDHHWRQMLDPASPNFMSLDRLTWRFASHLIGVMKPHSDIYEHVERTTKIPATKIAFFDDLQANIAAARQRGWNAYQIRADSDPIAQVRSQLREHGLRV
jgi:putative hydrolase of the HAD superfamily